MSNQRVYAGIAILIELIRREFCKQPLASVVVVVIHPVINQGFGFFERRDVRHSGADFVFHVAEKAFLRGVVQVKIPLVGFFFRETLAFRCL